MKKSRTKRAQDLAEWFHAQANAGTEESDLMARAALALERIAQKAAAPVLANDNNLARRVYR